MCGYPKRVFFMMDCFVIARFYRWSRRLSQRRSKCLAPDALKIPRERMTWSYSLLRRDWPCEGYIVKKQNRAG